MEVGDLRDAVQDSVILFRESHPAVIYELHLPEQPVMASFDRRLVTQAVTNLVKNATEAVDGVRPERGERLAGPRRHQRRTPRTARPPSRSSTTVPACRSTIARACWSPTSRPRATRAPASASRSCRRSPSSTAASFCSTTRRPRPAARTARASRSRYPDACRYRPHRWRIRPSAGGIDPAARIIDLHESLRSERWQQTS